MEKVEIKGSVIRIRECAFDLFALEEDLCGECDDEEWWGLMEGDIRLKSTFLYCDLSKVISSADDECKQALTDLANKLLFFMEQLHNAVKGRNISAMHEQYSDTMLALQELVAALIPP